MSQPHGDPNELPPVPPPDRPEPPAGPPEQPAGPPEQPAGPPEPPKRRGALIAAIVVGIALLLCGGGGTAAYVYLTRADQQGAASPTAAVNDLLVAVYREQDATKANRLVCAQARDKDELTKKINEVKAYRKAHQDPEFTWPEPTVTEQRGDTATVDVTVKATTKDEKVAEESLRFTVLKRTGWLVCEVTPGE